jgi:hypothetical protein
VGSIYNNDERHVDVAIVGIIGKDVGKLAIIERMGAI